MRARNVAALRANSAREINSQEPAPFTRPVFVPRKLAASLAALCQVAAARKSVATSRLTWERSLFLSRESQYSKDMARLPEKTVGIMTRLPSRTAVRGASAPSPRVDNRPPETIAPEHRDAVLEGIAQADRGEFVTDAEMKATLRRFGP